jgi:hypothetical protein
MATAASSKGAGSLPVLPVGSSSIIQAQCPPLASVPNARLTGVAVDPCAAKARNQRFSEEVISRRAANGDVPSTSSKPELSFDR